MKTSKNWPKIVIEIVRHPGDFSDWYLETLVAVAQAELRRRKKKGK